MILLALLGSALAGPLRYAEDRAPGILHPAFATTMAEVRINELIFEPLFGEDRSLQTSPRLATGFTTSPDARSMTVNLRPGVRWHDGQPFTARDVVFTVQALGDPATASPEAARVAFVASVAAVDDHTVQFTFHQPELEPASRLGFKILPAHAFSGLPLRREDAFRAHPIGTGPYRFEAYQEDGSITLTRHAEWWGEASLTGLVMREISDNNYQAKLLLYESLEALVRVLPRDLALLRADRKITLYPYQTNSWWFCGFNQNHPALAQPAVREGLAHLVDVGSLLAPIGTGERVTGPFVPSSPYYNHQVAARQPNPDAAARALQSAGYVFNGRHWVDRGGEALRLRLIAPADLESAQEVVVNLQSQLQTRGVLVDPVFLTAAEWKQRVWRERDFDLLLSQWTFDRHEDIREQFHSSGTKNLTGYQSAEVDRLLDLARATTDPQARRAHLQAVHRQVAADLPMVFLFTLDSWAAVSAKVKNVAVHPFSFFNWVDGWTLP